MKKIVSLFAALVMFISLMAVPALANSSNYHFIDGIERYEYCLGDEYVVDPSAKPWDYCYLYSMPSDINGRNMGRYNKGEVVKVIEYYGGGNNSFNYCFVMTQDHKLGYMHDYALKPVDGYTGGGYTGGGYHDGGFYYKGKYYSGNYAECDAHEYYINPSQKPWNYCYLYDMPSAEDGRNLGRYEKGELVKVIDYYGGGWYGNDNYCFVMTKDGKTGYMHDYALEYANFPI